MRFCKDLIEMMMLCVDDVRTYRNFALCCKLTGAVAR